MTDHKNDPLVPEDEALLDALFTDARADHSVVSDALTARILADADAVAQKPRPQQRDSFVRRLRAWGQDLFDGLGGWGAVAGLSTATIAGLWIGGSGLDMPTTLMPFSTELADELALGEDDLGLLFPGYFDLAEGI